MNLQHLRYFLTLADLEHYTDAAKQLHITQPTLSHAIAALESEVKVPLFVKKGRNIVLTEAGKDFYKIVKTSINLLDTGVKQLQQTHQKQHRINLTLLRILGRKAVPNLVRTFIEQHPDTQSEFDFHNDSGMSADMLEGIQNDQYDLAFCSKIESFSSISFIPIFTQDLVLIVPKGHPLSAKEQVTVEDTLDYPQVWFSKRSGMRPVLEQVFSEISKRPKIAFEVSEDETVVGLVAQQFGIAIAPKADFLKDFDDIDIIPIKSLKNRRVYYAAYHKGKELHNDLKNFIDFIATQSEMMNLSI